LRVFCPCLVFLFQCLLLVAAQTTTPEPSCNNFEIFGTLNETRANLQLCNDFVGVNGTRCAGYVVATALVGSQAPGDYYIKCDAFTAESLGTLRTPTCQEYRDIIVPAFITLYHVTYGTTCNGDIDFSTVSDYSCAPASAFAIDATVDAIARGCVSRPEGCLGYYRDTGSVPVQTALFCTPLAGANLSVGLTDCDELSNAILMPGARLYCGDTVYGLSPGGNLTTVALEETTAVGTEDQTTTPASVPATTSAAEATTGTAEATPSNSAASTPSETTPIVTQTTLPPMEQCSDFFLQGTLTEAQASLQQCNDYIAVNGTHCHGYIIQERGGDFVAVCKHFSQLSLARDPTCEEFLDYIVPMSASTALRDTAYGTTCNGTIDLSTTSNLRCAPSTSVTADTVDNVARECVARPGNCIGFYNPEAAMLGCLPHGAMTIYFGTDKCAETALPMLDQGQRLYCEGLVYSLLPDGNVTSNPVPTEVSAAESLKMAVGVLVILLQLMH
jgi:hypothetical protein